MSLGDGVGVFADAPDGRPDWRQHVRMSGRPDCPASPTGRQPGRPDWRLRLVGTILLRQ